jgi:hypothetical protein
LANTLDAAVQARDDAIANAQQTRDDALADAEQQWKESYEAAATAEEQSNATAYAAYISAVTAAGVAYDDAVSAAVVAQDEADAAAGVAWTNTVAAAWQQQQLAEAAAVVADAEDESQAAVADITADDTAWQTDEHTATLDAATHDNNEAAAAVADANADQDAEATWEKIEAQAADADQKAVAAADEKAALDQDAAVRAGNDQIAQAQKTQENNDAKAAQTHDTTVATVHHDTVVQEAQLADAAIQAAAAQAAQGVQADVQPAPAALTAAAKAALDDAQAKNADLTAKSIDVADTARADLLSRVQAQGAAANQAAQQQYDTDSKRDLNDPVILQQNPPPPQSWIQTVIDHFPSWKTVGGVVTLGTAALVIPGAGPVLFAVGVGLLAVSTAYSAYDRYFNQNQSGLQSLLGGAADATGVTSLFAGITGRDLATQHHLGLTEAQQRQMLTEGSIQTVGSVLLLYGGVRSFLRGRTPAAPKPSSEAVPDAATPPAKPTAGSNAGKPGTAEQATVQTACFVAGTPVRLRYGCKPIEQIQKGDHVLSRDQYNPLAPVVEQVVEETFIRTAPVLRLTVGGRELRPTGEHPFYVPGRGWVLAWSLRSGDVIHTLEGEAVRVDAVEDRGEVVRVYNFRVRELQTYFVGGDDWGFAIWSHNTNGHEAGSTEPQSNTLQSRGHTLNRSTADKLNKLNQTTYNRREFGRALEAIKTNNSLPPNYHQIKILDNGDVLDNQTGEWLGNLFDEL